MWGSPQVPEANPYSFDRRLSNKSSERGETTSAVGTYDDVASVSDSHYSTVVGLRDRLLREARSERQRCLEVAEAADRKRSSGLSATVHIGTQTDPVVVLDSSVANFDGPFGSASSSAMLSSGALLPGIWNATDEAAQTEALRTIALLGERQGNHSDGRVLELEGQVRAECASRQELETQVAHERSRKEAAQQQVLCLEYELDGKEGALQVAEHTLERRDADLQQAQLRLRALQESNAAVATGYSGGPGLGAEDLRFAALRAQLNERDRQLELKDQHIARLLNVLRQHRSIFVEDDAASLGSNYRLS